MERWRSIPGYEGFYDVSDQGRVRSVRRGRLMRLTMERDGYRRVMFSVKNRTSRQPVHVLVARAFIGECPPHHEVNHKRGNKSNNRLSNLEYLTRSQNNKHAYDVLGKKSQQGSAHGRSKLKEKDVVSIRAMRHNGAKLREIAERFHVSCSTISEACTGRHWRHVCSPELA